MEDKEFRVRLIAVLVAIENRLGDLVRQQEITANACEQVSGVFPEVSPWDSDMQGTRNQRLEQAHAVLYNGGAAAPRSTPGGGL